MTGHIAMNMVKVAANLIPKKYMLKLKPIEEEYHFLNQGLLMKQIHRLKTKTADITQIYSQYFS